MNQPKSPRDSETTITELMVPAYANFGGKIHGGILLSMMDKVAYACATKHTGMYCVTVSVDNVDFRQPVEVGELVSMDARINYVGKTSLVVGIRVISENVKDGISKHTNTSYFTMVAKDDEGNPYVIPELILENSLDVRRFMESIFRKYQRSSLRDSMKEIKKTFNLEHELKKLEDERCIIRLNEE